MHCSLNELEDAALTFPVLFQDVIYQVNAARQESFLSIRPLEGAIIIYIQYWYGS